MWQFKTTETYSLIVLEAKCPKLKSQQGWFLLEPLREYLLHVSLFMGVHGGFITSTSTSVFTLPSLLALPCHLAIGLVARTGGGDRS